MRRNAYVVKIITSACGTTWRPRFIASNPHFIDSTKHFFFQLEKESYHRQFLLGSIFMKIVMIETA